MFGLGRISRATSVEVVDSGWRSGEAVVRVTAVESPLTLFTGAVESPNLVPDLGLTVVTDYILRPDTPLLEVRSTVTIGAEEAEFAPGDVLQGGLETVHPWDPVVGLGAPGEDDRRFTGYLGEANEGAWAMIPEPGKTAPAGPDGQLLASVGDLIAMFEEPVNKPAGAELTYVRYYAVGRDMAEITDAIAVLDGVATRTESGTVTSGGEPVGGARVHVYVDEALYTVAFTDSEGAWQAEVPEGATVRVRASGQLDGVQQDLPEGWGRWGPYSAGNDRVAGSTPVLAAEGYGLASLESPLELPEPAWLTVRAADGAPFEVRVLGDAGERDSALFPNPPDGTLALGWARDGEVRMAVPAGSLTVQAHRGLRFERDTQEIELAPGEERTLDVTLQEAIAVDGWVVSDPHSHSAGSPDGLISMEARLIGTAARGIELHVGTDHDNIADYRPLVDALGLGPYLRSIVAEEVSPPTRGHMNIWPLTPDLELPNNGAIRWWSDIPDDTEELVSRYAALGGGERVFVQSNHPTDGGVASSARWSPGRIRSRDKWTENLDLIEVNNGGAVADYSRVYLDLVSRGYEVAPVGVSDAHDYTSGGLGLNVTFLGTGTDLAGATDDAVRQALAAGRTVASRGVFLELSEDPGSTVTGGGTLTVTAHSASWARVDRIVLYVNGERGEVVPGSSATFQLQPAEDAVYNVVAEGDTAMGGPYGSQTPWAMTSGVFVDVGGDGWTAPKPPLE